MKKNMVKSVDFHISKSFIIVYECEFEYTIHFHCFPIITTYIELAAPKDFRFE